MSAPRVKQKWTRLALHGRSGRAGPAWPKAADGSRCPVDREWLCSAGIVIADRATRVSD